MYLKYTLNDLRRNRGVNISLLVVLVLSAFLMASGAMVMERTLGSVNALFDQAKPPHFLQMHKGAYDKAALDAFATAHPEIDSWLIEDMVGYDSAAMGSTGHDGVRHPGGEPYRQPLRHAKHRVRLPPRCRQHHRVPG